MKSRALAYVAAKTRGGHEAALPVTLHFHPDRSTVDGRPLLDAMAEDGFYRNQFETGTSNGGLTARPGGDRWHWESRMFGGAYDDAPAAERPKYGALNFRRRAVGGAPRFGSAHFRMAAHTLGRTTFCYPDSVLDPADFGHGTRVSALIELAEQDDTDLLDDYIEAHVHGPVDLATDVEALVLDPSHRGTDVEKAASRLSCPVEWHPGFRLSIEELERHPAYRGAEFVELGLALAEDGHLDPRVLGEARHLDQQALKRVWHYVARFGALP
ncbi:DUF3626 domain-containing protein [Amycolatopsis sp. EV170708-02-1]|uniref:DUF3626 domain-containing protein n=1 Tax=Amycolatopsis sp. EV170708-02-1 TaxID=2919322 RepID=UPI001F0B87F1|nr:DUF3626 domain-containing protein [Amycolatopsis sp. EV170708-02-1]UMP00407.1 DUF3626 domain-containing protein [Amycolatopsis sp. EV170708-02-1]